MRVFFENMVHLHRAVFQKTPPHEFLSSLSCKKSASYNQLVHFYKTEKMNYVIDFVSFFPFLFYF